MKCISRASGPSSRLQIILLSTSVFWISACGLMNQGTKNSVTESTEAAQEVGDIMSSVDETGGSTGSISDRMETEATRLFARVDQRFTSPIDQLKRWSLHAFKTISFISPAYAVSCIGNGFGGCTGGDQKIRTFGSCTLGALTLNGTITDRWSVNNNCHMLAISDSITRVPAYTVTRSNGDVLTVSKTGSIGQRLTWTSGTPGTTQAFSFSSDGIRRQISNGSTTLYDFTTSTSTNLTIIGSDRSSGSTYRTINGGTIHVTNAKTSVDCSFSPYNVTWGSANCNCASSGSWVGSCSDGKAITMQISGCGKATLIVAGVTETVTFDRCTGS